MFETVFQDLLNFLSNWKTANIVPHRLWLLCIVEEWIRDITKDASLCFWKFSGSQDIWEIKIRVSFGWKFYAEGYMQFLFLYLLLHFITCILDKIGNIILPTNFPSSMSIYKIIKQLMKINFSSFFSREKACWIFRSPLPDVSHFAQFLLRRRHPDQRHFVGVDRSTLKALCIGRNWSFAKLLRTKIQWSGKSAVNNLSTVENLSSCTT